MKIFARRAAMVTGAIVALAAALVLWPAPPAPLPEPGTSRVIANVRVVDVTTGTLGNPVSIVIRNGAIAAMGVDAAAAGFPVLDGKGAFVVPAFWDMHVHTFQSSPQLHQPLWIANGVTNVRDMMDCPDETDTLIACAGDKRGWNEAIAKGRMAAPRYVQTASYYLESPDLTPQVARERVRTYKGRGIDAIKVYNRLPQASYLAAAEEARRHAMPLVGHLPKAVSLDQAVDAGQRSFEHAHLFLRHCSSRGADWRAGRLDAVEPTELVEMLIETQDAARCEQAFTDMKDADAWFVPTHVTREEDARAADPAFTEDPRLDYLDPLSRWAWNDDLGGTRSRYPGDRGERALRAYFDEGVRMTGRAHRAGVGILVGTDTALGGLRYHDELGHLVSAGLAPADVLRAATLDAARYAGMEDASGSIDIGKRADLVLLDANPLADIAATRRIRAVIQGGRLYDRGRLDALLAFVEGQAAAPHNWAKLVWGLVRSSVSSDL